MSINSWPLITTVAGLTCFWNIRDTNSMIKRRYTKYYEGKMRSNNVEYSMSTGLYCTTHEFKVSFFMPYFSSSKIIEHRFHVDKDKGELRIGYNMIIGRDLIVQLGVTTDFKCQVFQWDGTEVLMKEDSGLLGKSDSSKREMREVVMHTAKPASTREATERLVKITDITYAKVDLKQIADNATHINDELRT